jgi:hypothetical protein
MKCLGLHNKAMAEVHLGHKPTGPKEEEEGGGGGGGGGEEEEMLATSLQKDRAAKLLNTLQQNGDITCLKSCPLSYCSEMMWHLFASNLFYFLSPVIK